MKFSPKEITELFRAATLFLLAILVFFLLIAVGIIELGTLTSILDIATQHTPKSI